MSVFHSIGLLIRAFFRDRAELAVENLALRQQLAILNEKNKRPKLRPRDRVFWVWLSRFWANWRSVLLVVQPDTVVGWHRQGFKLYWRWKSRMGKVGRPKIELRSRAGYSFHSAENAFVRNSIPLSRGTTGTGRTQHSRERRLTKSTFVCGRPTSDHASNHEHAGLARRGAPNLAHSSPDSPAIVLRSKWASMTEGDTFRSYR